MGTVRWTLLGIAAIATVTTACKGLSKQTLGDRVSPIEHDETAYPSDNAYTVVAQGGKLYATHEYGLSVSTDQGQTWRTYALGCQGTFLACSGVAGGGALYVDGSKIFVGIKGGIARSMDGGNTWDTRTLGIANAFPSKLFSDGSTLYSQTVVGISGHGYSSSSDNGDTWTNYSRADLMGNDNVYSIVPLGSLLFILTTNANGVLQKFEAATWSDVTPPELDGATTTGATTVTTAIMALGSTLYMSTNLGLYVSHDLAATWTVLSTAAGLGDTDVGALGYDGSRIWVASSYRPQINYSSDGGVTWHAKAIGSGSFYATTVSGEGNVLILGAAGQGIAVSTDAGNTFSFQKR